MKQKVENVLTSEPATFHKIQWVFNEQMLAWILLIWPPPCHPLPWALSLLPRVCQMIQIIEGKKTKSKKCFSNKSYSLVPACPGIPCSLCGKKYSCRESVLLFYVLHPRFIVFANVKLLNSYLMNKWVSKQILLIFIYISLFSCMNLTNKSTMHSILHNTLKI